MEINEVSQTIFNCINYEICGQNEKIVLPEISSRFLIDLYKLSKAHDVAHLVGDALNKSGIFENLPADIDENERAAISKVKKKFDELLFTAIYRYENINYELGRLKETLEEAKIPFIPLKGSVIRKYYPEPWMRTSCDIDILVHENDLENAVSLLVEKYGVTREAKGSHDVGLFLNSVHIELHYSLIESDIVSKADIPLQNVWDYARPINETSRYAMNDEMFYYYHVAHMAKHFIHGGCGIRPFIDLWLYNRVNTGNTDKRNELLLEGGLLKFSEKTEKLSSVWVEGKKHDITTQEMEGFILRGGVYGTFDNSVIIQQSKKRGKCYYVLSRIFLPYKTLTKYYPKLKKRKWLLPFYEVKRWLEILFSKRIKHGIREFSISNNIKKEEYEETQHMIETLGL